MAVHAMQVTEGLVAQIMPTSRRVVGKSDIFAAMLCSDHVLGLSLDQETVEVLLVVRDFKPRLAHHVVTIDGKTVAVMAVDQWVFERDVDRGFLGEASASGLIFPYDALENPDYLAAQEVKLKGRLIDELLENLVVSFPEMCHQILIKPEYFMFEAMLNRARLFPPIKYALINLAEASNKKGSSQQVLEGYLAALKQLRIAGRIHFMDGCVRITDDFAKKSKNRRVKLTNLLKPAQRTLFASLLSAYPRIMAFLSRNEEALVRFQHFVKTGTKPLLGFEEPEKYLFVQTAHGYVPLASRMGIDAYARRLLSTTPDSHVTVEDIGGLLNDVFLITARNGSGESKVVVKRFRDWSSFKWLPLSLWALGTRTFTVLARSRLDKEVAINHLLGSKGFDVPKILHVSADERLVFMEYVEGENASGIIKRFATSSSSRSVRKDSTAIKRIGRKFAKVHALGIALGDTKPENILIGKRGEIRLMDFEQAARNGDTAWDLAEFLYYAGHYVPPLADVEIAQRISEVFIKGYLEAGGKAQTVAKAGTAKYTKVFSVFTLPHIVIAISNAFRQASELEE